MPVVTRNLSNENSNVTKTKPNRLMLLSNCHICGKKKSGFINNQELNNFHKFEMTSLK